jgi:hypothetical protein
MTRHGLVLRQAPVPKRPPSDAQHHSRAVMATTSSGWRGLTDSQRAAWEARARQAKCRKRLGLAAALKGSQLYNKINCALVAAGLPRVIDPPPIPKFNLNPVRGLNVSNTRGQIRLLLRVPTAPAQYTLVLGSPPCSAGISCRCNFRILGLLPASVRGFSDISDLYIEAFGKPLVGSRIFIRTRQIIEGWEDGTLQTTALVPAP